MSVDQHAHVLALPRRDTVTTTLYRAGMAALFVAYLSVLGAWTLRTAAAVALTALAGLGLALTLLRAWRALHGPQPALTAEGIRLPGSTLGRPALVPWARVHLVWIDGRLGSRSLAVLPRGEGPHKVRYLPLPADPVRTDGLDALLRRYSGGQVGLAEHPPEDDGGDLPRGARVVPQPRRRAPVHTVAPRRLLSAGPALILLLPVVLALPEPWNQPWWPGAHLTLRAPDPCAALSPDLTAAVIGDAVAAHRTGDGGGASGCSVESGSTTLIVRYSVHTATFGSSVREADAYLHTAEPDGRTERLALGDDAWLAGKAPGSRAIYLGPSQLLVSRRGNVVVEVSYTGAGDPAVVRPAVVAIGTRAVQSIRLG